MLNYIWGFMIFIGVLYGALTGNIADVSEAMLCSAKDAVTLCFTMLGVMSMWTGMMEIARSSGMLASARRWIVPMIRNLFPDVPQDHAVWDDISMNIVANVLGLGWAATPAGLNAMEKLSAIKHQLGVREEVASDAMCSFLIINISSLQLIPINVVMYRSQYGSVNPAKIIMPSIVATIVTTAVGVIFCKIMIKKGSKRLNGTARKKED